MCSMYQHITGVKTKMSSGEIKTIDWNQESYPHPVMGSVMTDYDGQKWRVIKKRNLKITIESFEWPKPTQ